MKWIVAASLFFILSSCASIKREAISYRGYSIEKEFIPYVKSFEKDCKTDVKIHIRFSDMGADLPFILDDIIGYCWPVPPRFIHISSKWWDKNLFTNRREELIYHELGHCLLFKMHNDDLGESGREKSIMSSKMFTNPYQYIALKKQYIKELCGDR